MPEGPRCTQQPRGPSGFKDPPRTTQPAHGGLFCAQKTGRQSLDQLKCLEEYSGGEVAAHSWTNATHTAGFTGVTTDVLDTELRLMKEWLIDNGFQGRDLPTYPLGNFNGAVMDKAAKYYKFPG